MISRIVLAEKFASFSETWAPRVVGELNGQQVKVARLEGEFVWHHHEQEDELFWVIEGRLAIELRDGTVELGPGELCIVPRGVEHRPVAHGTVKVVLFEPASTLNTGNVRDARTRDELDRI